MDDVVKTKLRRRTLLCGSWLCNNTDPPTAPEGDGKVARTDVGTYVVTLPHKYSGMDYVSAFLNNDTGDQIPAKVRHVTTGATSTLTITVKDLSGAALADVNAMRLGWIAIASGRAA